MTVLASKDVVCRELEGEAVLLDLSTGLYFGLNAVGTRIWSLLSEHGDTEKVIRPLLDEFDVDEARLRGDVERLVEQLTAKGLLKANV